MSTMPYSHSQVVFQQQYESVRRDEVVGVLLAFFLGGFGIHQFYLGRVGWGILYLCLSWTPIPWVLGFFEAFFMPGRVRMYNAVQEAGLAASLGIAVPGWMGYSGWVAPGWGAAGWNASAYVAQPVYAPVHGEEQTLVACGNCRQANPSRVRYCSNCGTNLA